MESKIHFWVTREKKKKSHPDILSLTPSPKKVMVKTAPYIGSEFRANDSRPTRCFCPTSTVNRYSKRQLRAYQVSCFRTKRIWLTSKCHEEVSTDALSTPARSHIYCLRGMMECYTAQPTLWLSITWTTLDDIYNLDDT